jgi:YspA, cpYpsA-related SLOG family
MNYAVIGSRSFNDYRKLKAICKKMISPKDTIISGGASGADHMAKLYAQENQINYIEYPANWTLHGKRAGFLRNITIIENSNMVIAFWDGTSKGTEHSINLAKQQKKPTFIIYI